jgi:two-component system response regulator (stage 0 sporulation protein F)
MNEDKRILVIDDDLGILESFDVLLGEDYEMVTAQNGYQALERLKDGSYKVVFLDIKMPGMDGIEVLRWIRSQPGDARVVIVTGLPQEEYEEEARELGVDGYVRKPFDVSEVQRIVDILN